MGRVPVSAGALLVKPCSPIGSVLLPKFAHASSGGGTTTPPAPRQMMGEVPKYASCAITAGSLHVAKALKKPGPTQPYTPVEFAITNPHAI